MITVRIIKQQQLLKNTMRTSNLDFSPFIHRQVLNLYPFYQNYLNPQFYIPLRNAQLYPFMSTDGYDLVNNYQGSLTDRQIGKNAAKMEESFSDKKSFSDERKVNDNKKSNPIKIFTLDQRNRNVLPNNNNLILSYIRRINKSGRIVEKIINKLVGKNHSNYTTKKFYNYQKYLKDNCNDFVNKEAIFAMISYQSPGCPSYTLNDQRFYNKVCRMLVWSYLKEICILQALGYRRLKQNSRKDHLKIQRYILQTLENPNGILKIEYK